MKISNELKTIFSLALAFTLLFLIFKNVVFIILALILFIAGTSSVTLRRIISGGWLRLVHFVGKVNTKLLLMLVFFVILTPLAVIRRMVSGSRKNQDKKSTNWTMRNHVFEPIDFEKLW